MAGSVQELINQRYGVRTTFRANPLTNDIDTTSKQVLRQDPRRLAFVLINLSANDVYLAPRVAASSTFGFILAPNGTIAMNWEEDFILPTLEWHAAASVDNSTVFLLELLIDTVSGEVEP